MIYPSLVDITKIGYPAGLRVTSLKSTSVIFSWNKAMYLEEGYSSAAITYQYRMYHGSSYVMSKISDPSVTSFAMENLVPCTYGYYGFSIAYMQEAQRSVGEFTPILPVNTPTLSMPLCLHVCVFVRMSVSYCCKYW